VAKSVFGGGDSGHKHFLTVLNYCWTVLVRLPRVITQHDNDVEPTNMSGSQANRFGVFENDIDDEDIDVVDADIFPSSVPRPEPEPEPMCLDDLINSDERHDAILFLLALDELMGSVAEQYQAVRNNHRQNLAHLFPQSNIVEMLIEAAVATNMGIQQVQLLDMELSLQYPHLTTPYRLLSTVVLPDITREVASIMREHAAEKVAEKDVIVFLGDCLECSFRNVSDSCNRAEFIVPEFCKEYKVDARGKEKVSQLVEGLRMTIMLEVPLALKKRQNQSFVALLRKQFPSYHSHHWLSTKSMPHISGGRAIHHTTRLLQTFGDIINGTGAKRQAVAIRGCFGPDPWVQGRSTKIAGDMDELLMADILPQLITFFRHGILGKAVLPMVDEIAPLWVNLREYITHPEKAVSWPLVFSVHAMLTAVLETDHIMDSLMAWSESAFQTFFEQLDSSSVLLHNEPDSTFTNDPRFRHNIVMASALQNLGLPVFGKRAIWNPLYAGTTLSYLAFVGSLEVGCSVVDGRAQLRIVMFLYHGLLLNGIIEPDENLFLDILYTSFKNSRAVWEGPLPRRGELVQRFWTCHGMNLKNSKKMAEEARGMYASKTMAGGRADNVGVYLGRSRKMIPIEPEEVSKSFRRVCNHDFHDVVDKYHTQDQRERGKHSDGYMMAVRINDTLDAIDEEQALLSFNLIACSVILEQFVCSMTRVMQWDPLIQSFIQHNSKLQLDHRQGVIQIFAQHLLAALDFSPAPIDHEFLRVPLGLASASFLTEFFERLNPGAVVWFNAIRGQEE